MVSYCLLFRGGFVWIWCFMFAGWVCLLSVVMVCGYSMLIVLFNLCYRWCCVFWFIM